MKKQRNHSQLKDPKTIPLKEQNETDLFSLIDKEFKNEVMEILKEIIRAFDRNADY